MHYEPFKDDRVLDTRLNKGANYIRRRRETLDGSKKRYTTYEIKEADYKRLEKLELENRMLRGDLKKKNKVLDRLKKIINSEA